MLLRDTIFALSLDGTDTLWELERPRASREVLDSLSLLMKLRGAEPRAARLDTAGTSDAVFDPVRIDCRAVLPSVLARLVLLTTLPPAFRAMSPDCVIPRAKSDTNI